MQYILPILLCTKTFTDETNDIGEPVSASSVERKVYVSEESVKRSEFYQANAIGYKVEKVLNIRKFEYSNEELIKIVTGSVTEEYKVIRVDDLKDGTLNLVLSKGVNRSVCT
jgi:hypothetical protein